MEQEWLLLDMHMHSHCSAITKKGDSKKVRKMTAKEFINTISCKGVKIFSVTDHNYYSKDYYDSLDKYISDNNLSMKLINGVEFDVYVDLEESKENYIHVCIYFDDDVDREKLETTVKSLYVDSDGNNLKPRFDEILGSLYELKTKMIIIPHGDKSRGLLDTHLFDKMSKSNIPEFYKYAMYKIFNAFDVKINFTNSSNNHWAKNFFFKTKQYSELLKEKTQEEIEDIETKILEKIKDTKIVLSDELNIIYDYILRYGSFFSYFVFSDWHNNSPYDPLINNFIFGNLDYAFSAFEMATLDPESRIIKSTESVIEIPDTILKEVSFKIGESLNTISFSPGLNAIVGKRNSGKSLLLSVLKNLSEKDAKDGAINKYSSLKISDICAKNRGNIDISLESLNSVEFLTQAQITEIFEDPSKAQKSISAYFLDIKSLDLTVLNKIVKIGENIKPYNLDYKTLTSNILSIKKTSNFNYNTHNLLNEIKAKANFQKILGEYDDLIDNIRDLKLDVSLLKKQQKEINDNKMYYLALISKYNDLLEKHNSRIQEFNSGLTSNQITFNQNMKDIRNAVNLLKENLLIQLYLEKFKKLVNNFSIDNPPVEIAKKGKYLFVTCYDIPGDLKNQIEEKILKTIYRGSSMYDLDNYVKGESNKKLNGSFKTVVDELRKYLAGDAFKPKKEFYEIKNDAIDYKNSVKTLHDLKKHVENKNLVNLTNSSPGTMSVAYLDMLFDLEEKILILDQPEDNIDNDYISNYLVPNIKEKKQIKQLIFVTHNPSVAVYGDAFNYIYVENNDGIKYTNYLIEKYEDKEKLINILEGGRPSFSNRNKKFGNVIGYDEYGTD